MIAQSADRIILYHTPSCWFAEFRGPVALEMAAIAGGDTVPTGFNGHVPAAVVCSAIALLNPEAEVSLAESAEARPAVARGADPARALPKAPDENLQSVAAQVIGKYLPQAKPQREEKAPILDGAVLQRALKIRKTLGLMVACSYLKERGWSFEAAHRALLDAQPRKVEVVEPR